MSVYVMLADEQAREIGQAHMDCPPRPDDTIRILNLKRDAWVLYRVLRIEHDLSSNNESLTEKFESGAHILYAVVSQLQMERQQ